MINSIDANINKLNEIVPCDDEDKRYRLQIVVFGDDPTELAYSMKRMIQGIFPLYRKDVIE